MNPSRFQSLSVPELAAWVKTSAPTTRLKELIGALRRPWRPEEAAQFVAALDVETLWLLTIGSIEDQELQSAMRFRLLREPELRTDYAGQLVGTGKALSSEEFALFDDTDLDRLTEQFLEVWNPAGLYGFLSTVPPSRLSSVAWRSPFVAEMAQLVRDPSGATPTLDAELRRRFDETLSATPYEEHRTQDGVLAATVSTYPQPLLGRALESLRAMTALGDNATLAAYTLRLLNDVFHVPVTAASPAREGNAP